MSRILVITNDFPPRIGGIETFVFSLCKGLPADELVVYTARMDGSEEFDASVDFPVIRDRSRVLLPSLRVGREVRRVAKDFDCDRVVFGAAAALGLLARGLRKAGVRRIVGITHGHEVWWARVPLFRQLLRRIGDDADTLTYVSEYCRSRIAQALNRDAAARMVRLSPGIDTERFHPGVDGSELRQRLGIDQDAPIVLSVSRLVRRKGQDTLIRAWPLVVRRHPSAVLLILGDGPDRRRLRRLSRCLNISDTVKIVPGVPWIDMPAVYAAANVFALPCRTRMAGLQVEALGIVFLEAASSGLPVIAGNSGGTPEIVVETTGIIAENHEPKALATEMGRLLDAPESARMMGCDGRQLVQQLWSDAAMMRAWQEILGEPAGDMGDGG